MAQRPWGDIRILKCNRHLNHSHYRLKLSDFNAWKRLNYLKIVLFPFLLLLGDPLLAWRMVLLVAQQNVIHKRTVRRQKLNRHFQ